MKPNSYVFDFETSSTARDAGVVSIGALKFDRFNLDNTHQMISDGSFSLSLNIDLTEQFFLGFSFDQATARWWREKNKEQIKVVLENRISIREALEKFHAFIGDDELIAFCRHTHADYIWYDNICKLLDIKPKIKYNRVFDVSTAILTVYNEPKGYIVVDGYTNRHNALDDCFGDALQIATAMEKIRALA